MLCCFVFWLPHLWRQWVGLDLVVEGFNQNFRCGVVFGFVLLIASLFQCHGDGDG